VFSTRTGWDRTPTALAEGLAKRARPPEFDLTISNPTAVGFEMDSQLRATLSQPANARYAPDSLGAMAPREAIVDYYRARGRTSRPEDVWLCASTSEAYAYLAALACDPGQAIAVPRPGYPLFDFIADVVGVRLVHYPVRYDGRWHIDRAGLRDVVDREDPRAIVCIAPNNPTGNFLDEEELELVENLCVDDERALIVDEVFSDYALRSDPNRVPHVVGPRRCLTFVLSGLSKVAALPQAKLAWGVACGPAEARAEAMARLALLADTFLSASTPAQNLVQPALAAAPMRQAAILQRTRSNLAGMRERLADTSVDVLDVEGGWSAILRLPAVDGLDDLRWALALLDEDDVLVQPGRLFDLDGVRVVVSLLTPPLSFVEGIDLLAKRVARRTGRV
jgi:aspartate/methionine/tyrosine aminotransferase